MITPIDDLMIIYGIMRENLSGLICPTTKIRGLGNMNRSIISLRKGLIKVIKHIIDPL
jgi:hypothetical protein